MTEAERQRWDARYASGDYQARPFPSPLLTEWLPRLPGGHALDVATGTGRNALALAEAGYDVHAVDVSAVAIGRARSEADRRGVQVRWEVADLDELALAAGSYDLVTVFRYRNPELWPRLVEALAPDGWIVVEHHLRTTLDAAGPEDPAFRLEPQELLRVFGELRVIRYEETLEPGDDPAQTYALARLVACKGDPGF